MAFYEFFGVSFLGIVIVATIICDEGYITHEEHKKSIHVSSHGVDENDN